MSIGTHKNICCSPMFFHVPLCIPDWVVQLAGSLARCADDDAPVLMISTANMNRSQSGSFCALPRGSRRGSRRGFRRGSLNDAKRLGKALGKQLEELRTMVAERHRVRPFDGIFVNYIICSTYKATWIWWIENEFSRWCWPLQALN